MNKTYLQLSEQDRASFLTAVSEAAFVEAVEKTNKADDSSTGTFRVIVSTADRDRQGEIVSMEGWDLTMYKMNPVVLWAHDYWSQPVGVCTQIGAEMIDGKNCLVASGKFAPTDDGQQIRKLYEGGFLKTTSVGFIPKEFDNDTGTITKQELLEFSFVPVPANPFAISLSAAKKSGFNLSALARKGVVFTLTADTKAEDSDGDGTADQLGDACSLDDGTPGVLSEDPKNPNGALICIPDEAKSAKKKPKKDDDNDDDSNGGDADDNDQGDEGDAGNGEDGGDDSKAENEDGKKLVKALKEDMMKEHDRHTKSVKKATDDMEEKMFDLVNEKKSAETHEDCIDDFRAKMAVEHEKHLKNIKSIVTEHSKELQKKLGEYDKEDAMKQALANIEKSITEAIAIRITAGGEGNKDAKDADDADDAEEAEDDADGSKGTPNNGSKGARASEMSEFVFAREIVRGMQRSAEDALGKFNERARQIANSKK